MFLGMLSSCPTFTPHLFVPSERRRVLVYKPEKIHQILTFEVCMKKKKLCPMRPIHETDLEKNI